SNSPSPGDGRTVPDSQHWSRRSRGRTHDRQVATSLQGQEEGEVPTGETGVEAAEARRTQERRRGPEPRRRAVGKGTPGYAAAPLGRLSERMKTRRPSRSASGRGVGCGGGPARPTRSRSGATQPRRPTAAI